MSDKDQEKDFKKLEKATDEFIPDLTPEKPEPVEPSPAAQQIAGYIVMGAHVCFGILAKRRGAHWIVTEAETTELHKSVSKVAEKYIDVDFSNPLYGLAATVAAIVLPRLMVEFLNKPEPEKNGNQSEHALAE